MLNLAQIPDFKEKAAKLQESIKSVPDFPKPGILFRDVTSLCEDADAFRLSIDLLEQIFKDDNIDKVVCAEARGFVFGAPLADRLHCGLVLVRKPGKLPRETLSESYALEYGTDLLQINVDAVKHGERVLVLDDLLATGGTVEAMVKLVRRLKGEVVAAAFVLELYDLGGADKLRHDAQVPVVSLVKFPGH